MEKDNRKLKIYIFIFLLVSSELLGIYRNLPIYPNLGVFDFIYAGLIVLTLVFFLSFKNFGFAKPNNTNQLWVVYSFAIILLCNFVYSLLRHHQSVNQVLSVSYLYLVIPLVAIYLNRAIKSANDCELIENMIIQFAVVISLVSLVQVLLHAINIDILNVIEGERYGGARIAIGISVEICGILMAYTKMREYHTLVYRMEFITILLCFIFAVRTRGLWIYIGASLIFFEIHKQKKHVNLYIVLLSLFTIGLIILDMVSEDAAMVALDSGDNHVIWRIRTMKWYFDQIIENPLFGLGLIKPIENTTSYTLLMGDWGRAFRSDVGFLGFINTFGVIGLGWYTFFIIVYIKKIMVLMANSRTTYSGPYLSYIFLSIVGATTFSIMANNQLYMVPVMFVLLIKRARFCS